MTFDVRMILKSCAAEVDIRLIHVQQDQASAPVDNLRRVSPVTARELDRRAEVELPKHWQKGRCRSPEPIDPVSVLRPFVVGVLGPVTGDRSSDPAEVITRDWLL